MKNNATVAAAVACAALIALAVWHFWSVPTSPYKTPPHEPPGKGVVGNPKTDNDPYDVVIGYTDAGFATTSVTIKQGTRVRFLNSSKQDEWPASGIHPTHTLYPEKEDSDCLGSSFDSCQSLKPGEFYDFTFYYPGMWPFHDHVHAYNTGQIVVQ